MNMMSGLAGKAASSGKGGGTITSNFMNMPPTQFQGFDHGYIRLGSVPRQAFGLTRNRFRPIMTFNNPADFVSGPQNKGDPEGVTQKADAIGGGTYGAKS